MKTVDSSNMGRPRHYDEALRNSLIAECSRIISAHGADGVSLRALAARAQTTTAAVYSLFGSRGALLQAVTDEAFVRFEQYLQTVEPTADPRRDLLALGMAYRRSALADPYFYRVMFSTGEATSRKRRLEEPTFEILRRGVARALPSADGARVELEAVRLWGLVHGLVSLELCGLLQGTADERAERYRQMLRMGPPQD